MTEPAGPSLCLQAERWFTLGHHDFGFATTLALSKVLSFLSLVVYLRVNTWLARHGHPRATTTLIFPIYKKILYLTGVVDITTALVLDVSPMVLGVRHITRFSRWWWW